MNSLINKLVRMGVGGAGTDPLSTAEILNMPSGEVTRLVVNMIGACANSPCMKSAYPIGEWCNKAANSDFGKGYDETLAPQAMEFAIIFAKAVANFPDDVQTRARNEMVGSIYGGDLSDENVDYVFIKTVDVGTGAAVKAILAMLNFHYKEFVKQGGK